MVWSINYRHKATFSGDSQNFHFTLHSRHDRICSSTKIMGRGQIREVSTGTGDDDGNVGETTELIAGEDKRNTWICDIDLISGLSCPHVRLQLPHFQVVVRTWESFWEITAVALHSYRQWSNRTWAETEIWAKFRIGKIAKALKYPYGDSFFLVPRVAVAVMPVCSHKSSF